MNVHNEESRSGTGVSYGKVKPELSPQELKQMEHNRALESLQALLAIIIGTIGFLLFIITKYLSSNSPASNALIEFLVIAAIILVTLLYITKMRSAIIIEEDLGKDYERYIEKIASKGAFALFISSEIILSGIFLYQSGLLPFLSPSLIPANASYVMVVAYNQTILPNVYHISIQNLGSQPSQSFSFYITPTNSSVNISAVSWQYIGVTWLSINFGRSAYFIVNSIQGNAFGFMTVNLSGPSGIKFSQVEIPGDHCGTILYGLNDRGNITSNTIVNGNCTIQVLESAIFRTAVVSKVEVKPYENCSNSIVETLIPPETPNNTVFSFAIPSNRSTRLTYYLYLNNKLINTYLPGGYNAIILNLSGVVKPSFFEIYTPGNMNYSCREILLGYGYNETT